MGAEEELQRLRDKAFHELKLYGDKMRHAVELEEEAGEHFRNYERLDDEACKAAAKLRGDRYGR